MAATLVHGEPGIGKTALVTEVARGFVAGGGTALWGRCMRFGADRCPYLPFSQALSQWRRQAAASDRARVFGDADEMAAMIPSSADGLRRPMDEARMLYLLTTVVERIAESGPTALVIDDLHWADTSSLDAVAYIVAGLPRDRGVTVLGTYRDTELGEGHRLLGWLADLRRMPAVTEIALGPLDSLGTELLVERLGLRTRPDTEDVFSVARGNPYLTELVALAADQEPVAGSRLPGTLRDALLASWHRLPKSARLLMQLVSVGGRPVGLDVLDTLASRLGIDPGDIRRDLAAAEMEGVAMRTTPGEVWFRHPALAEVIASTVAPPDARRYHLLYASIWEDALESSAADRCSHLALHYDGAGMADEAFGWSVRAADEAASIQAIAEETANLRRACALWSSLSEAASVMAGDQVRLLSRAGAAAEAAGDFRAALEFYEQALALIDQEARPRETSRLLLPLAELRDLAGVADGSLEPEFARQAVALVEHLPLCEEQPLALARLAIMEHWSGHAAAAVHAEEAVKTAKALNSSVCLAWALGVRSQTGWDTGQGIPDAQASLMLARQQADPALVALAAEWLHNCYEMRGRIDQAARTAVDVFRELTDSVTPHAATSVGATAAAASFSLGDWKLTEGILREALVLRCAQRWGAPARCVAAVLTAKQGDLEASRLHLARAEELMPNAAAAGDNLAWAQLETALCSGDARRAMGLAETAIHESLQIAPGAADEYLLLGARAAADLASSAAADGLRTRQARAGLDRLERARGSTPTPFEQVGPDDTLHPAWAALYAAERARCLNDRSNLADLWSAAADRCAAATMPWEGALANLRLAEILLSSRKGQRQRGMEAARRAHEVAVRLGAHPLKVETEALATQAHVPLDNVLAGPPPAEPAISGLTPREQEILRHVVAGQTYAEIASALFISTKTVSVHISNVLRKTGTANRIELAAFVRKIEQSTDD